MCIITSPYRRCSSIVEHLVANRFYAHGATPVSDCRSEFNMAPRRMLPLSLLTILIVIQGFCQRAPRSNLATQDTHLHVPI